MPATRDAADRGRVIDALIAVNASLAGKVTPQQLADGLSAKVNTATYTAGLAAKADTATVDSALAGKLSGVKDSAGATLAAVDGVVTLPAIPMQAAGPDVTCWGDSLTAAGTYPSALAAALGVTVTNRGVGGESSRGVAARQGGAPLRLLPAGNQIPASGGVAVTFAPAVTWPLLQGPSTEHGTLGGVPGVLSITKQTPGSYTHEAGDVYTFTRDTPGSAVPMARPTPFIPDIAVAALGDIQVLWAGRNNHLDTAQVLADVKAMIRYLEAGLRQPRYLVLSVINGHAEGTGTASHTAITTINNALAAEYGSRYIDVRSWLIAYGLADAAIRATVPDTSDIAADIVPPSLRSDAVHLTPAAYTSVARQVAKRVVELGWGDLAETWTEGPALAAMPQLLPNGGFDTDITGWEGYGGAVITRVTSQPYAGAGCLEIDHSTSTTSGARTATSFPVTPGTINGSIVVKAAAGHHARFIIHCLAADGDYVGNVLGDAICNGDWMQIQFSKTLPAGTTHIVPEVIKADSSSGEDITVLVDSVQVWQ